MVKLIAIFMLVSVAKAQQQKIVKGKQK